jgi:L-fuconolactonase
MIVDAHAHMWRRERTPQPWIEPDTMAAIDADFWTDELAAAQRSQGINGAIVVQSSSTVSETLDLLEASDGRTILGVVGWVDLESDVARAIAKLRNANGGRYLVGIRHPAHQDPDVAWLARKGVGAGLEQLADHGLPFDLVVRADQLETAEDMVSAHPGVNFVLDHLGKPPIASSDLDTWRRNIASIAAHPNVVAKLSGLAIEADWHGWTAEQLEPVIRTALDEFGPKRLMFGTDWPLIELTRGARTWISTALALVPNEHHTAVFATNTITAYSLKGLDA